MVEGNFCYSPFSVEVKLKALMISQRRHWQSSMGQPGWFGLYSYFPLRTLSSTISL